MPEQYIKPERVWLRRHAELTEKWVQDKIARDPSILGLGDLVLRDQERIQPRAGRLDLLLQDLETKRRYQVELQLGITDESHIIRCIEYWDYERKRYPQYDHCAVLIAEDITSRFLNVVSLFNGTIPIIGIQMGAYKVGGSLTLIFTKVVDELSRGVIDEDEADAAAPTDRTYWENKATKHTVALADQLFALMKDKDPTLELKYNKFYIGVSKGGVAFNFVSLRPRKKWIDLLIRLPESPEVETRIENANLQLLERDKWGNYVVRINQGDVATNTEPLRDLMTLAYDHRINGG